MELSIFSKIEHSEKIAQLPVGDHSHLPVAVGSNGGSLKIDGNTEIPVLLIWDLHAP